MPEFLSILSLTWLSGILLIAGIVLVVIEMFLPGFGVPGISGAICIIVGFILAVDNLLEGIVLFMIVTFVLGIALTIAMRLYAKGTLNRTQLVLGSELSAEAGFNSLDDAGVEPGARGVVTTTLRPVGIIEIGGKKHEAQSEAAYIEKGTEVRVISTEGRRIIVAPGEDI